MKSTLKDAIINTTIAVIVVGGIIALIYLFGHLMRVKPPTLGYGAALDTSMACKPEAGDTKDGVDVYTAYSNDIASITSALAELKTIDVTKLSPELVTQLTQIIADADDALAKISSQLKTCSEWCSTSQTATWDKSKYACNCKPGYGSPSTSTGVVVCNLNNEVTLARNDITLLAEKLQSLQQSIKSPSVSFI